MITLQCIAPLPTEEEDKDRVVGMASMSFYKYISIKNKHLVKNKLLGGQKCCGFVNKF